MKETSLSSNAYHTVWHTAFAEKLPKRASVQLVMPTTVNADAEIGAVILTLQLAQVFWGKEGLNNY